MICAYYRLRFVTILLRIVAQSRPVQNAVKIYLPPGRHPVISAIAPELASRFAHILTEPLPENITALLQRLDAKLSISPCSYSAITPILLLRIASPRPAPPIVRCCSPKGDKVARRRRQETPTAGGRVQRGEEQVTLGNMRANGVRTLAAWCLGHGCKIRFASLF
jgi:hypothetical protein